MTRPLERFGIGQPVRRVEDARLLAGLGAFIDDRTVPGMAHGWVLRSPHAHAEIGAIDTAAAGAMPGVLAVLTGADAAADRLGPVPCIFMPADVGGGTPKPAPYPVLAQDRVRFVGEAVAFVVAETQAAARDAGEHIEIDYRPLPSVIDSEQALAADAPVIWPERGGNVAFTWQAGDEAAVNDAFARAAHRVRLDLVNNRVVVAALETRGALGVFDRATGRHHLTTASQMPHPLRAELAKIFGEPEDRFHIVIGDVGGGFGAKNSTYPEQALVLWAARRLGRPVKWIAERGEAFLADFQGRDNLTRAELALDAEARFLALRVETLANLGAYVAGRGGLSPVVNVPALIGTYLTKAAYVRVQGVYTNTVPTDVYRGAGRPEAVYAIERLVDVAARDLAIDRIDLRRRNMIPPERLPYKTPLGLTYDSGGYAETLDQGLHRADFAGFERRRDQARGRGRLRGFGFANYVERCGAGVSDSAALTIDAEGKLTILIGTMANGQGHQTAYTQIAASLLGIDPARIQVIQGDTDRVKEGKGTGGSRSIPLGGAAIADGATRLIDKARRIAAHLLEAAIEDIEFQAGRFRIAGTDRVLGWAEIAAAAHDRQRLLPDIEPGLDETGRFNPTNHTFPNGCHLCEVEIDPETGHLDIVGYTVVHDFGRVLNPLLLAGQVHGGVAQGLGQAGYERVVFDHATGQPLCGSFMDYCLPHADQIPAIDVHAIETAAPSNPLGFKGCGEAGAAGAPPALVNAVVDALKPLGVRHVDMPLTDERLWRVIDAARQGGHGRI